MQLRPDKTAEERRLLERLETASANLSPLQLKTRMLQTHIERLRPDELWQISEFLQLFAGASGSLCAGGSDSSALLDRLTSCLDEQSIKLTQLLGKLTWIPTLPTTRSNVEPQESFPHDSQRTSSTLLVARTNATSSPTQTPYPKESHSAQSGMRTKQCSYSFLNLFTIIIIKSTRIIFKYAPFLFADITKTPLATIVDSIKLKLVELSNALPSEVNDTDELEKLFKDVAHYLEEFRNELKNGYRLLASNNKTGEKELAAGCSDAGGAILGLLKKMQIYSEDIPKVKRTGYSMILSYFKDLANDLKEMTALSENKIVLGIQQRFQKSLNNFSQIIINSLK